MKQRESGELVGFTDGAANRIAQYESGFRVPKEDMVKKIAAALHVKERALLEPDTGNLGGIMETLFWLDENMPDMLSCSLTMPLDKS
ncbi:MAG: helix-turn-helix transcriptional regulator [Oscillospiraceae bacterium]|nr:helix-turn-helix transcriptional regulator [Oscillospiraceae bacterium]